MIIRKENSKKLYYWIMGIGYICWNKKTKKEDAVFKNFEDANFWIDE